MIIYTIYRSTWALNNFFNFMEIKSLQEKKEKEIHSFFRLGLYIAFIFSLPAALAIIISKIFSENPNSKIITTIALLISFIFSWLTVIFFYLKKSKKIKKIEDEIIRLKNEKKY